MPLTITAKRDGHRRCGMRHSGKPVTHPDGTFSEEQVAALKADPRLIVVEIVEPETAAEPVTEEAPVSEPETATEPVAKPEGEALTAAILAIIPKLESDAYTQAGSPKVKSVEAALGYDVTADEVAAAWAEYSETGAE